jgi:hypothetical protein
MQEYTYTPARDLIVNSILGALGVLGVLGAERTEPIPSKTQTLLPSIGSA